MRILVNGCSFSRGPNSWPYYLTGLTDKSGHNVVNLACSGSGNTYIHETTTRILEREKFDLVLIMWTGIHRIDKQVEDASLFESHSTSCYQKTQNDWPEKIIEPINDQDFIEDNWLYGGTAIFNVDEEISSVFKNDYQLIGEKEFINQFIIKVVSLQNTLKQLGIPYAFSFYQDYVDQIKHSNMIDWNNCILTDNLYTIAKRLNSYDEDEWHPGLEANKQWAKCVVEHLTQKNII